MTEQEALNFLNDQYTKCKFMVAPTGETFYITTSLFAWAKAEKAFTLLGIGFEMLIRNYEQGVMDKFERVYEVHETLEHILNIAAIQETQ